MATEKRKVIDDCLADEFERQENCDIYFTVDGKKIGAHMVILRLRCNVLYKMALECPTENHVSIEDMSYNTLNILLKYLYTREMPISQENVAVLCGARRFGMNKLEELYEPHIIESIGTENVCSFMEDAIKFKSQAIQKKCLDIFSKETAKVFEGNSFKKLSQSALSAFLDVDSTNVLEIALFRRVKQWMVQKCQDASISVDGVNMRSVIGEALYKIRFPTMIIQDFTNTVMTIKGFLEDSEIVQIVQKITFFENAGIECIFQDQYRCQKSHFWVPVWDLEKLCKKKVLRNRWNERYQDFSSFLQHLVDSSDKIGCELGSYRILLQCYADLENSSPIETHANDDNKDIRCALQDDFYTWLSTAKAKNVSEIMTEFLQMRAKLNKICKWAFD